MRIALVACCAKKTAEPGRARDVYASALFKKSLAYAERVADRTFILSAKLGLITPDDWIEPYEVTLRTMPASERAAWAQRVRAQLPAGQYLYLAGTLYREQLPEGEVPMAGLGIGQQLQWLTRKLTPPRGSITAPYEVKPYRSRRVSRTRPQ